MMRLFAYSVKWRLPFGTTSTSLGWYCTRDSLFLSIGYPLIRLCTDTRWVYRIGGKEKEYDLSSFVSRRHMDYTGRSAASGAQALRGHAAPIRIESVMRYCVRCSAPSNDSLCFCGSITIDPNIDRLGWRNRPLHRLGEVPHTKGIGHEAVPTK